MLAASVAAAPSNGLITPAATAAAAAAACSPGIPAVPGVITGDLIAGCAASTQTVHAEYCSTAG